jgi:hypothetical protein
VSCVGSFAEVFSNWLHIQLKKLLPLSQTYLRDSNQVLEELEAIGHLPPSAKLFTADAVSMYTNIDTRHAMIVFRQWFRDYSTEIPTDFPKELFLAVLEIVMTGMCLVSTTLSGCKLLPEPQWAQAVLVCMQPCIMPYMSNNPPSIH